MMGHVLRAFTSAAMPKHHDFKAIETVTPHVTNAGTPNLHPQVHRPLTTASSNRPLWRHQPRPKPDPRCSGKSLA